MANRNYQIKFTPIASEELAGIYHYISKELHAEGAAVNLMEKTEEDVLKQPRENPRFKPWDESGIHHVD